MISGAFAAALTPLSAGGGVDEGAFAPYVEYLAAGGVDGILACGTTGEGVLLTARERQRVAELFLDQATPRGLALAVHCGAQSTADTVALAAHAAGIGAAAVAVIAPPYFALDESALQAHFEAAAAACAPLPFYVYEFEARSGYAVPLPLVARLRERVPNLRGLKVSDRPWEKLAPYLLDGLDVFIGPESLVARGLEHGAAGAVSGLAAVYPDVVSALVRDRTAELAEEAERLRVELDRFPFHAAAKVVAAGRGVPIGPDVRAPLRRLTEAELAELTLP